MYLSIWLSFYLSICLHVYLTISTNQSISYLYIYLLINLSPSNLYIHCRIFRYATIITLNCQLLHDSALFVILCPFFLYFLLIFLLPSYLPPLFSSPRLFLIHLFFFASLLYFVFPSSIFALPHFHTPRRTTHIN